ncbi:MAG TPA: hypothetical protein GX724_03205 [Fibrobacter sp.]|nr:hypothetical protein [Fibrobacter sp.]
MIEVLKQFYSVHYNVGALCVLVFMGLFFVLTKKNYRTALILAVILTAFNIFIYNKTANRVWTLTEGEQTWKFSVLKDWTIKDEKGVVHHWCWLDEWWYQISKTDLVGKLWGTKEVESYRKTSEERMDQ